MTFSTLMARSFAVILDESSTDLRVCADPGGEGGC